MSSSQQDDRDVAAVARIEAVPSILKVLCQVTGMGFAAVARVTDGSWVACAVEDAIGFGLLPGNRLDVDTTLCKEVRQAESPIAIDHASRDPIYAAHATPKAYGLESYVSVPIVLPDGDYFGNLCALDPKPAAVNNEKTLALFSHFAHLIALELDNQRRLDAVREQLADEKADGALREQFIAVLGHDLRNPLSSILASAHLLKAKSADPAMVVGLARRIDANATRIARLVDDLLDFARGRLGGGLLVAGNEVSDLAGAITDVIDELRAANPERDLRAMVAIDKPVRGDRVRIQQLVSNLVGNALTHGSPSAPIVVRAKRDDDGVEISVRNEGEAIPPDTLRDMFGAFNRQASGAGRAGGLGLGLYICEQIVKAHGGDLQVESSVEGGTVFTARLPNG